MNIDRDVAYVYHYPLTRRLKGEPVEWALIPEGSTSVIVHKKRGPEFLSVEDGEFVFRTAKFLYGIEAEFRGDSYHTQNTQNYVEFLRINLTCPIITIQARMSPSAIFAALSNSSRKQRGNDHHHPRLRHRSGCEGCL